MERFIILACLFISAHCASISNADNLRDINFVKTNIKGAENMLSTLELQLNYEMENNPSFRNEPEMLEIRNEMNHLYSELTSMNRLTRHLERQLNHASHSSTKRTRRDVEQRQNAVVETTSTVVNSAAVGIQSTLNTLNNLMVNINRGVNNLFNRITNQITNVAVSANNAAQSGVQTLNNGAQAAITNANNAATAVVNTVYTGVQGAAQGVGTAIQTGYSAVTNVAQNVAQNAANAAASTVNRLTG